MLYDKYNRYRFLLKYLFEFQLYMIYMLFA